MILPSELRLRKYTHFCSESLNLARQAFFFKAPSKDIFKLLKLLSCKYYVEIDHL